MKNKWTDFLGKTWEFDDMGIAISNGTLIPPGGILYDGKYLVINQESGSSYSWIYDYNFETAYKFIFFVNKGRKNRNI